MVHLFLLAEVCLHYMHACGLVGLHFVLVKEFFGALSTKCGPKIEMKVLNLSSC